MADSENDVEDPAHFTFIWTIENMSVPCNVNSPTFTVKDIEMTKWYLCICCDNLKFSELSLCRERTDGGPECIEIKYELSVLSKDGLPLLKEVKVCNDDDIAYCEFDFRGIFFERRAEFMPKDSLTVRCRMWRTGTEIERPDMCFARTRLRPHRHCFVWAIREFSSLQRDQERRIDLKTTSRNHLTFKLFVEEKDGEEYLSIDIEHSHCYRRAFEICLLDFEGKNVHSQERCYKFEQFIKKDRLMNDKDSLLPNDTLSLRCEVKYYADVVFNVIENYRYLNFTRSEVTDKDTGDILIYEEDEASKVSFSLTEDLKGLLEEGTLSDVTLRVGSNSFPAHKCVLSARSSVFKAMFTGDMKEKTSKSVEIPDIDENSLKELLSYIYTNTVSDLEWQGAIDLFRAADKYELLDLKKLCSTQLMSDLSTTNVCAILSVADLHQDGKLRDAAEEFVMYQNIEFFKSDTWKSFKTENSVLAFEIVERILCNMKN